MTAPNRENEEIGVNSPELPNAPHAGNDALRSSVSRLMRGLNHDLKNPLGAADGYLQLMAEGVVGDVSDKQRDMMGRVRGLLGDALAIVEDVVTFARASIGELDTYMRPTDLSSLAHVTVDELRGAAGERGITLDVETAQGPVRVTTDGDLVMQILRHLVSNALEHTQQGGTVLVCAEMRANAPGGGGGDGGDGDGDADRAMAALSVADDGSGIAPEDLERAFLEFERIEPGGSGAGFGLPLGRALARLLGGWLEVESEPGVGSTFTLLLPAD